MDELKKEAREELSTMMVAWEEMMPPGEKAIARPLVIMDFMDGMIDKVALRVIEMCEVAIPVKDGEADAGDVLEGHPTYEYARGFNSCREEIISKIKALKETISSKDA